jgi:hypothetical protein
MFKIGGNTFCYKKYMDRGVFFINDFFNNSGSIHTFQNFQEIFQVQTNFLQYQSIIQSIRHYLDSLSLSHKATNLKNPVRPDIMRSILLQDRGCRNIYDSFCVKKVLPNARLKWENEIISHHINWKMVYQLPFKISKDSKLQWFQYRINNRILGTNYLLKKMGIKGNDSCTFCGSSPETLSHLFWDCDIVKNFWKNIQDWVNQTCPFIRLELSKQDAILGNLKHSVAISNIILIARLHIYQNKMKLDRPSIQSFKKNVSLLFATEKYNAIKQLNIDKFNATWGLFAALS